MSSNTRSVIKATNLFSLLMIEYYTLSVMLATKNNVISVMLRDFSHHHWYKVQIRVIVNSKYL